MNRKNGGGIIVVAIVLGVLIGQFWKFPGLGTNDPQQTSDSTSEQEQSTPAAPTEPLENPLVSVDPGQGPGTSPRQEETVTVVIFGSGYRLTRVLDPETGVDIALQPLIDQARSTTGDPNGIRVRLLLHPTAQEGARFDLLRALKEAGIRQEQIQEFEPPQL